MSLKDGISLGGYNRTVSSMFLTPDGCVPMSPYIHFGIAQTLVDNTVLSIGRVDTLVDNLKRKIECKKCSDFDEAIYDMLVEVSNDLSIGLMDFMNNLIANSLCANYSDIVKNYSNEDDNEGFGVTFGDEDEMDDDFEDVKLEEDEEDSFDGLIDLLSQK